jgi:hypothetical protein
MNHWLKPSNGLCLAGVTGIAGGLCFLGIGWAIGFVGCVALSFGAYLSKRGL